MRQNLGIAGQHIHPIFFAERGLQPLNLILRAGFSSEQASDEFFVIAISVHEMAMLLPYKYLTKTDSIITSAIQTFLHLCYIPCPVGQT
jgi:hypothetical protein